MLAEVLSTGDEVLTGAVVDSNSAHIAEKLCEAGLEVSRHNCVGDELERLRAVILEIAARADIAVVTGGIGPTFDDLTSAAMAAAAGVELVFDPVADESIRRFFEARGRQSSSADQKQAMLPKGSICLPNPVGTAPGFQLQVGRCCFFCLPGVPSEMVRMLDEAVLPRIRKLQGGAKETRVLKTMCLFGLPEAVVSERLAGFEQALPGIKFGLRASFPVIQIKLYIHGENLSHVQKQVQSAVDWVLERLGQWIFSTEGETMEEAIGRLLKERSQTLAVAESCTGGLISNLLTNVPGSSAYFLFSAVTYSNQAKQDLLGVAPETLSAHGAVDEATVREMAVGVRRFSGATYGLATSGIAGPEGGTDHKPVGTICIGIATPTETRSKRYVLSFGSRSRNKTIFTMAALETLRRELLGSEQQSLK